MCDYILHKQFLSGKLISLETTVLRLIAYLAYLCDYVLHKQFQFAAPIQSISHILRPAERESFTMSLC